ncbi:MAG: TauD/TfdA family dioxygenase [Frankiaceae bacterium]
MLATPAVTATGLPNLVYRPIVPFGLLVRPVAESVEVSSLGTQRLARWVDDVRVLVLRGFAPMTGEELLALCRAWGDRPAGDPGTVDAAVHDHAADRFLACGAVPCHWDGALAPVEPHYVVFHRGQALPTGSGGQTVICDTTRVCAKLGDAHLERWRRLSIGYRTATDAPCGGIVHALVSAHPTTGATRIRYAEPLSPEDCSSPLYLDVEDADEEEQERLVGELREELYAPDVCYLHEWRDGDIVVADNFAVLHGRRPVR